MSAVLGGDADVVLAALERHGLTPANVNGAGQVVAAGTMTQLAAFAAEFSGPDAPTKARVMPLKVAGAFHTHHMSPAVSVLQSYAPAITVHDPRVRLVSNADGNVVHDGREVLRRIVAQTERPVRWDLCMETFRDLGVTGLIEIPPAGTLANLAKRALPGIDIVALKTPDDLDAARELIRRHATTGEMDGSPSWRIVVSPTKGMVHRSELASGRPIEPGSTIEPGAPVAVVRGRRDEQSVRAGHAGTVVEWLVEEGDPVSPGQPLLRMMPAQEVAGAR
jgi:[acyl-carrier-protein] S-malonyltransferase